MDDKTGKNSQRSKVLIADEFPLIRDALSRHLNLQSDMIAAGQTENEDRTLNAIEELKPDAVVLSLYLPGAVGFELLRRIKLEHPELPVLATSIQNDPNQAAEALRAGAKGYTSKRETGEAILAAIRHILTGRIWVNKDFMPNLLDTYFTKAPTHENIKRILTKRELQIFEMIGRGVTTREIAEQLFISNRTVESHRDHIKVKLDAEDVFKLHQMAFQWVQEEMPLGS